MSFSFCLCLSIYLYILYNIIYMFYIIYNDSYYMYMYSIYNLVFVYIYIKYTYTCYCNFFTVMNHIVNIWYVWYLICGSQRGCQPQVENPWYMLVSVSSKYNVMFPFNLCPDFFCLKSVLATVLTSVYHIRLSNRNLENIARYIKTTWYSIWKLSVFGISVHFAYVVNNKIFF